MCESGRDGWNCNWLLFDIILKGRKLSPSHLHLHLLVVPSLYVPGQRFVIIHGSPPVHHLDFDSLIGM